VPYGILDARYRFIRHIISEISSQQCLLSPGSIDIERRGRGDNTPVSYLVGYGFRLSTETGNPSELFMVSLILTKQILGYLK
jgi:hypothetical protein